MTIRPPHRNLSRRPRSRARRRAGGLAVVVTLALAAAPTAAAAGDGEEAELLALLNGERATAGLAPVRFEPTLAAGARAHAAAMAARGRLFHTSMSGTAPTGWTKLGENVAMAANVASAHRALMASPPHKAVILDPRFDEVGLGITSGTGASRWVSMKLADRPGRALPDAPGRRTTAEGEVTAAGLTSHGDLAGTSLAAPIVARVPTPSGAGHWLVGADGGVFTFGDAPWHGSVAHVRLAAPIVGMAALPDGTGYWLAAADGGVFSLGDAPFLGAVAPARPASPVTSINATSTGAGYALRTADGTRYGFGDAR